MSWTAFGLVALTGCGTEAPNAIWVTTLADTPPGSGFVSLRQAIAAGQAADLPIRLSPELRGNIALQRPIVLKGPGRVRIEGEHRITLLADGHRHFEGLGPDVVLRGLTLRDGQSAKLGGGAIRMGVGNLSLVDCRFADNLSVAEEGGGAVFVDKAASLQVRDTTFENNTGVRGGAINTRSGRTVVIVGSRFIKNSAVRGASVFHAGAELLVGSSWFEDEDAYRGAIYLANTEGSSSIEGSNFINNRAIEGAVVYAADATRSAPIRFWTSQVRDSHATDGGALVVRRNRPLVVQDALFDHNISTAGPGAAIDSLSDLRVWRSEFTRNKAARSGGAIRVRAPSTDAGLWVEDTRFVSNESARGGAIEVEAGRALHVRNAAFIENRSRGRGGAVHLKLSAARSATFTNTVFTSNEAIQGGSALCNDDTNIVLRQAELPHLAKSVCDPTRLKTR